MSEMDEDGIEADKEADSVGVEDIVDQRFNEMKMLGMPYVKVGRPNISTSNVSQRHSSTAIPVQEKK